MTDQAPELLPCPFCGQPPAICELEDEPDSPCSFWVKCTHCGIETREHRFEADARKLWNTRPTPAERPVPQVREALAPPQDLPLYWRCRANAFRQLDAVRSDSDPATIAQCEAYEECAEELKAALTARPSDAAKPDFETAARALGFQQMPSGKWWAPNPLWHVTYMEHWDSAEAVFSWLWENRVTRPSDAAVAWREGISLLREVQGYAIANTDASRTQNDQDTWRAHWRNVTRAVDLLSSVAALPPDEPARVTPSTGGGEALIETAARAMYEFEPWEDGTTWNTMPEYSKEAFRETMRYVLCVVPTIASEGAAWQPIEDAPMDGTEILLYRDDSGPLLGRWIAPSDFLTETEYDGAFDSWDEPDWFVADFIKGSRLTDGMPTHWMPLPAPPAASLIAKGEVDPLDNLVSRFAKRLLAKLKLARANGRSGWERDDWETQCQEGLLRHLGKDDPRDVAAYCAFMDHHGWITKAPALPDGAVAWRWRQKDGTGRWIYDPEPAWLEAHRHEIQAQPLYASPHPESGDVEKLRNQLVKARAALAPLAKLADAYHEAHLNSIRMHRDEGRPDPRPHSDGHRVSISMGELRAARAALSDDQQEKSR